MSRGHHTVVIEKPSCSNERVSRMRRSSASVEANACNCIVSAIASDQRGRHGPSKTLGRLLVALHLELVSSVALAAEPADLENEIARQAKAQEAIRDAWVGIPSGKIAGRTDRAPRL